MTRIDTDLWTPFVKMWEEAAEAGFSPEELAWLASINVNTLRTRQFVLRQRGIMLPLLRGQRGPRASMPERVKEITRAAAPKCGAESMVIYVM